MTESPPETPFHRGLQYSRALAILHKHLKPEWYLEIGTLFGKCLAPAQCNTICVDPHIKIDPRYLAHKPRIFMFQMRNDDFFSTDFLDKSGVIFDIAFLDGLHLFEFLLRDFINTERYCHKDSVILLHDCLPLNIEMTVRTNDPSSRTDQETANKWTGDVWKVVRILQTYRPDLSITALDCPPTGLVMVRGLKPHSNVLRESYDAIMNEYGRLDLQEYGFDRYYKEVSVIDSNVALRPRSLVKLFGQPKQTEVEPVQDS